MSESLTKKLDLNVNKNVSSLNLLKIAECDKKDFFYFYLCWLNSKPKGVVSILIIL